MNIYLAFLLFVVGIAVIIKGSDVFVSAAGWISDVTGISKAVIGATLVSFATASPEFFVSLIAVLRGYNDLSVGNAVGSLLCNLGIGFAILSFFAHGHVKDSLFGLKGIIMIASTVLLLLFCLNGIITYVEGGILLAVYAVFTGINIRFSREKTRAAKKPTNPKEITANSLKFLLGAAAVILGANLIVNNGQEIAKYFGVSEAVIGLTIVAIGTSLPEIVTSITAVIKRESALSIGNIIGANIFDATLILGLNSLVSDGGLTVSKSTSAVDLPVTILIMIIAVIPVLIKRKMFRWQGVLLATVYAVYLISITFV